MLYASTTSAQVRPGRCIQVVYSDSGAVVAVADTCRQDTIWVEGDRAGGPWQFVGLRGVAITIVPGEDYPVYDTVITPASQVIFEGDTATIPADTVITQRTVHVRDSVVFSSDGTGCISGIPVALGYWTYERVERQTLTTERVCDTLCAYPVPVVRDTDYVELTQNGMHQLQQMQYSAIGLYRDTARVDTAGHATLAFYRTPSGRYVSNMKESIAGYPYRTWTPGVLYGKDYLSATVNASAGGSNAPRDTVVVQRRFAMTLILSYPSTRTTYSYLDTLPMPVPCDQYYNKWYNALLVKTPVNCRDTTGHTRSTTFEPRFVFTGDTALVDVDTCEIDCPKITVQSMTIRQDTLVRYDTIYEQTSIPVVTQTAVFGCSMLWTIPDSFHVSVQQYRWKQIPDSVFQAAKLAEGCDSAAGKIPILDTLIIERYYASPRQLLAVDTTTGRPFFLREWDCDSLGNPSPHTGWNADSMDYQGYRIVQRAKYCWLPSASVLGGGGCDAYEVRVTPARYKSILASCCEHDSTVVFARPDPSNPSRALFGSYTFRAPLYVDTCTYVRSDTTWQDSSVIARIDRNLYITGSPDTTYTYSITDTCGCNPEIDLANGAKQLCDPVRIRMDCARVQPYWDQDGSTIVIPCQWLGVTINGEHGDRFDGLLTVRDFIVILSLIDSLGRQCPSCVQTLADLLYQKIDSLQSEIALLQSCCMDCQTVELDGSGHWSEVLASEPSAVLLSYKSATSPAATLAWDYSGGTLIVTGTAGALVTYCKR